MTFSCVKDSEVKCASLENVFTITLFGAHHCCQLKLCFWNIVNYTHAKNSSVNAKVTKCLFTYSMRFNGKMKKDESYRNLRKRDTHTMQHVGNIHGTLVPCNEQSLSQECENGEKQENKLSVSSRHNSFSSCSNDSAVYCNSQFMQSDCVTSEKGAVLKMAKMSDKFVNKRHRNSSGSSALSSASDSSNRELKELKPVGVNGILKHLMVPVTCPVGSISKVSDSTSKMNEMDSNLTPVSLSSISVTETSTVETVVKKKTVSITTTCKSVNSSTQETDHFHNLRKRIRKRTCCNCDCSSSHATVIVRRYMQIQHETRTKKCSSPQKSKKSSSPNKTALPASTQIVSISTECKTVDTCSTSPSTQKRRRSEVDKLYADLHEIKWAKKFSRDNILVQYAHIRPAAASSHYSTSQKETFTPQKEASASQNETFTPQIEASASQKETFTPQKEASASQNETFTPQKEASASQKETSTSKSHAKQLVSSSSPVSKSVRMTRSSDARNLSTRSQTIIQKKFTKVKSDSIPSPSSPSVLDNSSAQKMCLSSSNSDALSVGFGVKEIVDFVQAVSSLSSKSSSDLINEESVNKLAEADMSEFIKSSNKDDLTMSLEQNGTTDVCTNAAVIDSDNSSFALDISPLNSEDDVSLELASLKPSNLLERKSLGISQSQNDCSNVLKLQIEKPELESCSPKKISDIPSLSLEVEHFKTDSNAVDSMSVADTTTTATTNFVAQEVIASESKPTRLLFSEEVKKTLKDQNHIFLTSLENTKAMGSFNFCIEKEITSTERKDLSELNDSFELPMLTITSPLKERSSDDDALPPSLEPYVDSQNPSELLHNDMMVYQHEINEIEVEIPCTNANTSGSEDSNMEVERDDGLSIQDLDECSNANMNSSHVEEPAKFDKISSNFTNKISYRPTSNHFVSKKILKRYIHLSRNKLKAHHSIQNTEHNACSNENLKTAENHGNLNGVKSKLCASVPTVITSTCDTNVKNSSTSNGEIVHLQRDHEVGKSRSMAHVKNTEELSDTQAVVTSRTSSSMSKSITTNNKMYQKVISGLPDDQKYTEFMSAEQSFSVVESSVPYKAPQKSTRFHIKKAIKRQHRIEVTSSNTEKKKAIRNQLLVQQRSDQFAIERRKQAKDAEDILRVSFDFTFHYKYITVNRHDSYTQVIMKLTRGQSIYLSVEALTELKDTLNNAMEDLSCQVLILNGTNSCFCSGIDLIPLLGEKKKEAAQEIAIAIKDLVQAIAAFHKPLVSVVNGSAVGFGVTLLTYSDVILASDTATFQMPYSQLGYFPEGGATLTLPQVVGSTTAMDMMMRGRKLSAVEARDCGLVSEVIIANRLPHELVARVRVLAENPLSAMETTKYMVRMHIFQMLKYSLEHEVEMLPKQWLSTSCQDNLQKAHENGLF